MRGAHQGRALASFRARQPLAEDRDRGDAILGRARRRVAAQLRELVGAQRGYSSYVLRSHAIRSGPFLPGYTPHPGRARMSISDTDRECSEHTRSKSAWRSAPRFLPTAQPDGRFGPASLHAELVCPARSQPLIAVRRSPLSWAARRSEAGDPPERALPRRLAAHRALLRRGHAGGPPRLRRLAHLRRRPPHGQVRAGHREGAGVVAEGAERACLVREP